MAKLYIVPTPIGNLGDITYRAIEVLKNVAMILAEDTRVTKKLLHHYDISTPLRSYHQHNEHKIINELVSKIQMGDQMAIVSDAGTPGISDPGFLLVRKCKENGIDIECLPGATALIPAIINSGIPSDRFYFEGFLPQKKGRKSRIETLLNFDKTVVLYESTHRILKLLKEVKEVAPSRQISVSRELTKKFEENVQGTAQQLLLHFETNSTKGEFVVVIQGNKA
ncbi:16S rRNA (cytidine(1402)-2'-O)-methyltransferase [Flavobacteriales bacterium]|nr:16S rRNA (cytidine(1402)-2'-O)-methyltransferase [Flavobacteriales bacterium]